MTILAIVIIVIIGLYILGGLIFSHRLLLKKLTVIPLIIAVGFLLLSNQFGDKTEAQRADLPYFQEVAPPYEYAPKVVQTISRVYYVATLTDDGRIITLLDYYSFNDSEWQYSDIDLILDRDIVGEMKVYNR